MGASFCRSGGKRCLQIGSGYACQRRLLFEPVIHEISRRRTRLVCRIYVVQVFFAHSFSFQGKEEKTVLPSLVTRQESVVLCSPCWWLERFRADGLFSWSFGYSTQYTLLCVCMRENAKECVFMGWVKAVLLKINRR